MIPPPATTPLAQPSRARAQPARGRPRGGGRSGGGQARCYAFPARPEEVSSNVMITCIVSMFRRDASILFDPGSTYSYVSSYFAHYLDMPDDSSPMLVHISTPVGYSNIVDRVYRSCVMIIGGLEMRIDLLLLSMVNFDVLFVMDWLSPCHAIFYYHAKIVALAMLGLPRVE
ncbi:uncharacterized protein [Nicotiana tomentosiformis]|uniref:uncharacterized protein n=1 Tax=Nicotiana tomentosiformis TaxID=4098 RepID=UPI00388C97DE